MFHEIYQKNINALKNVDIVLATKIIQASRGDSFELSIVSEKHQLYNIVDTLQEKALYENIIDELQENLQKLHPKNHEAFIYLFGIANAYALHILLDNKNHERIVVIEPELELLFVSFHLYDLSEDISRGRLKIFHQKSFNFAQVSHLFLEHNSHHFARNFDLIPTANYYQENFNDEIQLTQSLFLDALSYDLSYTTKDFDSSLNHLDFHLNNLPQILKHHSLQSLIQGCSRGDWSIIIATKPSQSELKNILKIRSYVTIFASQEVLEYLHSNDITPDIVTAIQYENGKWENIPKEVQQELLLVMPTSSNHINLHKCHANIIMTPTDAYYNRYFDFKAFGYLKEHHYDAHIAYELSFLLKHSHTIIIDDTLQETQTQNYQHYCYLCALYQSTMHSYHLLDHKVPNLCMGQDTLIKLANKITKEKPLKKIFTMHPDKPEDIQAIKARQNLKISHLVTEGYQLTQEIQKALVTLQPWFDKLEGLAEIEVIYFYSDSDLLVLVDTISAVKSSIEKSHIYQRFFHDFLQPSMLLFNIEQANIQSKAITSDQINKEKAIQWSILNYQWLIELQRNMPKTIELLLKYHNDYQASA